VLEQMRRVLRAPEMIVGVTERAVQLDPSLDDAQVAKRVNDDEVLCLLKRVLRATGKRGVPQGGVISPLLSNLYLNEVDQMLEKAKEVTWYRELAMIEYARFADDLVVLVSAHPLLRGEWQLPGVESLR
jgi:RNA-directed DNA polymerase